VVSSTADRQKPRILVLIKGLGIGGAERLISEAAPVWNRDEFDYRVAYVLPWKDQLVDDLETHQVKVTCVGGTSGLDIQTPWRLRRLIADWRPDLIHAHLPAAGILSRLSTSVPTIYTEHNLADSYRQPTRTLNRLTYFRNAAVIAVSEAVNESLIGFPGPSPNVIPNGVAASANRSGTDVRQELGIGPDTPLIVHVGNIRPHKGHSNLIAATAHLGAKMPELLVVSIGVEKNEGDIDRLTADATSRGVEHLIRFLGRRPDALDFMAAADVVVNPSDVEGLPVTILEAHSLARPVVATDVGGVASIVTDHETGLLVSPGDPAALAEAIEVALTSPEAEGWARSGADLVREHHSITAMIEGYESVYREIRSG